jgi:uncharacterized protein
VSADEWFLETEDPLAVTAVTAIHAGDLATLTRLLSDHPALARVRLGTSEGMSRALLHVVTDWPGHYPGGPSTVVALVAAGADVNVRFTGPHTETPLHWAASNDDVAVLDALLDAGADIEADGAVIAGGTPLTDARAFRQWRAARRLVERGARTGIVDAATLGLMDRLHACFTDATPPTPGDVDRAFWGACHGSQQAAAAYLLERGAQINWIPDWEPLTPLDAAHRSEATDLTGWLRERGGRSASELP